MDEGRAFSRPVARRWYADAEKRPGRVNFVTIATPDRAAQSRIFARSARQCHPGARLTVLVVNSDTSPWIFSGCYDLVISADELPLSGLADMRFRYSVAELCFALKPWLIRNVSKKFPDEPIYYFDSDIELFTPLAEVEAALAGGANLVLTPHILQPAPDQDRERALLRSGSFNAGFLAVAPSAAARAFVVWWCDRVRTGCVNDHPTGTYGDQKWLELAPAICDGVVVLRHPGYNFAYWNAHERPLSRLGGAWTAAGWPLRFVHYSQWNMREQDPAQYLARYFHRKYEPVTRLFAEYRDKVRDEERFGEADPPPIYGAALAPCGTPVPDLLRRAYERHAPAADGDASAVFARATSVLNAPSNARADLPDLPISVLYDEIWRHHADLKYRFAVDHASGRLAYLQWLVGQGAAELGLPAAFLPPARSVLENEPVRQLEAGDAAAAPPPAIADPDPLRQSDTDIRLLVSSNKALRRELQALKLRHWRDEETIQALDEELIKTRRSRDALTRRNQRLADDVAHPGSRPWQVVVGWQGAWRRSNRTKLGGRPVLPADHPFFECGFRLGEAARIAGSTVRRIKRAPSGMLIFGPYVALAPGAYVVAVDARLYQRLPLVGRFTLEIVCDDARQLVESRKFRLRATARPQRFEQVFMVLDGDDYPDFEMRIWARRGTPLEIGRIELSEISATDAAPAAAADPAW
jgi:hypothetical protein